LLPRRCLPPKRESDHVKLTGNTTEGGQDPETVTITGLPTNEAVNVATELSKGGRYIVLKLGYTLLRGIANNAGCTAGILEIDGLILLKVKVLWNEVTYINPPIPTRSKGCNHWRILHMYKLE